MNYLICCQHYVAWSAGVRTMYYLGELLSELGHNVYSFDQNPSPTWRGGIFTPNIAVDCCIVGECQELRTDASIKTARWVLNVPGKLGGPIRYGPSETVFYFGEELQHPATLAARGKTYPLMLGHIDPDIVHADPDIVKDLSLWYQGKFVGNGPQKIDNVLEITRTWPTDRRETIGLLQRAKTLWSLDNFTALVPEAYLCGAKVKVWDGGIWSDYVPNKPERFIIKHERDIESARYFNSIMESP